ncbi:MAG: purine-nucleoside phosphorylase [Bacteroidota bacterium]
MIKQVNEIKQKLDETLSVIRKETSMAPEIGVILGTGLGGFAAEIEKHTEISYAELPNFPRPTMEIHNGKLIFGRVAGKEIVAMQGRFHYYEGYTMQQITFPVRVMKRLGIEQLLISNACGSVNRYFRRGTLMAIDDHINLLGNNPLIGPNDDEEGPRFPDMSRPWSAGLISLAEEIAMENNIKLNRGVYAAMTGPCLETRAEYRMLQVIGADVVGMSTVPENIVANQLGLDVLGISVITDECYPDALRPVDINEILEVAGRTEPMLTKLFKQVIERI